MFLQSLIDTFLMYLYDPVALKKQQKKNIRKERNFDDPVVRLVYIKEKYRVVTIAYKVFKNKTIDNIEFAASIFHNERDDPMSKKMLEKMPEPEKTVKIEAISKEVFSRKQHAFTSQDRLKNHPLYITCGTPDSHFDHDYFRDLTKEMRKTIHVKGTHFRI